jgi:hypothetical protein
VYNYRLAAMPPGSTAHVRFYGQEWDKGKADFTGPACEADDVRLGPIPPVDPSSGEPNWALASTTLDTTSHADQSLIFWAVVWIEQNGELVPELMGHGLTAIPEATTAPTAVAIERYSNNVGFHQQPFFVCSNPCPRFSAASAAEADALVVEKVDVAPERVSISDSVTVTTTLLANGRSLDGVLLDYYDGDPQHGGTAFDAAMIPHVRASETYVNRVKFRPRTCGNRTVVVVAQGTATGTATVSVDCPGSFAGKAERVAGGAGKGTVTFSGKVPGAGVLNLRVATVTVTALLGEIGAGELVRGHGGAPFLPLTLSARRGSKAAAAIFETPAGHRPSVEIEVKQRDPKNGEVEFSLKVERATIPVPPTGCGPGGGHAVPLTTSMAIEDGSPASRQVSAVLPWRCGRSELRTP